MSQHYRAHQSVKPDQSKTSTHSPKSSQTDTRPFATNVTKPAVSELPNPCGQSTHSPVDMSTVAIFPSIQAKQASTSIGSSSRQSSAPLPTAPTPHNDGFLKQGLYTSPRSSSLGAPSYQIPHVVQHQGLSISRWPTSQLPTPKVTPAQTVTLSTQPGVVQRYIKIESLFPLLTKLDDRQKHNVMHWNAQHMFDSVANNPSELRKKISEFADISSSVATGELAPGQTHRDEKLPSWLDYFSEFTTNLPKGWGKLKFKKGFDRMTKHGWISDNPVLPKDIFPNGVSVHVILAVPESDATPKQVTIKPHVTVRVKAVQDKFDQIALLNDSIIKSQETQKLGLEGTQNSLSIGTRSVREKADTNASKNIGKTIKELQEYFTQEWLENIVKDAWLDAQSDRSVKKTEQFICDGATTEINPVEPKVETPPSGMLGKTEIDPEPKDQSAHEEVLETTLKDKEQSQVRSEKLPIAQKTVEQSVQQKTKDSEPSTDALLITPEVSHRVKQQTGLTLPSNGWIRLAVLLAVIAILYKVFA